MVLTQRCSNELIENQLISRMYRYPAKIQLNRVKLNKKGPAVLLLSGL